MYDPIQLNQCVLYINNKCILIWNPQVYIYKKTCVFLYKELEDTERMKIQWFSINSLDKPLEKSM